MKKTQNIHLFDSEMNYPMADGNNYIPSVSYVKTWNYAVNIVESMEELSEALEMGGNIKLACDLEMSSAMVISKSVHMDLNGKSVKSEGDAFEVVAGGELVITGNGVVEAGMNPGGNVAVWANGGIVIIENGSFSVGTDPNGNTNDCLYAKGGTIVVNGGNFKNSGEYNPSMGGVVVNAHNSIENSLVIVNGGEFEAPEGGVVVEQADLDNGRVIWKKA